MSDNDNDERVVVERVVMEHGRIVEASSPEAAAMFAEQIAHGRAREERRREVWGTDNTDQIVRLARSFPSLRRAGGLDPWDPIAFLDWSTGPARTGGSWHASMFVLSVWNSDDWSRVAREHGWLSDAERVYDERRTATELGLASTDADADVIPSELVDRAEHAVKCARSYTFRAADAISVWDEQHLNAFLAWCQLPFYP